MSSFVKDEGLNHLSHQENDALADLYGYYEEVPLIDNNEEADVYSGCDYQKEEFQSERLFDEYSYKSQQQCRERNFSSSFGDNTQGREDHHGGSSQPVAVQQCLLPKDITSAEPQSAYRQPKIKQPLYANIAAGSRSLHALVSASKQPLAKKPKKTVSEKSSSTNKSFSTKNRILQAEKERKKNSNHEVEPLFLNPFTSQNTDTINIQAFQKIYKIDYDLLLEKIESISKKVSLIGEKTFFKDKNNQNQLNEVFHLLGLKTSVKLGKAKSIRQLKAVFKFMKVPNPQDSQQKGNNTGHNTGQFQPSYISAFRTLMGYEMSGQQQKLSDKKGLMGYGFEKLQRKH